MCVTVNIIPLEPMPVFGKTGVVQHEKTGVVGALNGRYKQSIIYSVLELIRTVSLCMRVAVDYYFSSKNKSCHKPSRFVADPRGAHPSAHHRPRRLPELTYIAQHVAPAHRAEFFRTCRQSIYIHSTVDYFTVVSK